MHADTDVLDQRVWIDFKAIVIGQRQKAFAGLGQRWFQQPPVFGTQNNVFEHRKILDQLEMLEHHPDACGNRGLAVRDICLFATDENLAFISFVKAVEDAHQRGLARAVFTNDPMDRAGHNTNGNVFVGLHRAKGLGNAPKLNGWSGSCLPLHVCRVVHVQKLNAGQVSSAI